MKRIVDILLALLHLAFYAVCFLCFMAGIAGLVEWFMTKVGGNAGGYGPEGALLQLSAVLHVPFAVVCVLAVIGAGYITTFFTGLVKKICLMSWRIKHDLL